MKYVLLSLTLIGCTYTKVEARDNKLQTYDYEIACVLGNNVVNYKFGAATNSVYDGRYIFITRDGTIFYLPVDNCLVQKKETSE